MKQILFLNILVAPGSGDVRHDILREQSRCPSLSSWFLYYQLQAQMSERRQTAFKNYSRHKSLLLNCFGENNAVGYMITIKKSEMQLVFVRA